MLSHEHLLQGLTHEDFFVRSPIFANVIYVGGAGIETTRAAIAAIERYGWDNTYENEYLLCDLPQDAGTLDWMAEALDQPDDQPPCTATRAHLHFGFSQAPVGCVEPHLPRLEKAARNPRFRAIVQSRLSYTALEQARCRLELAAKDALACRALFEKTLKLVPHLEKQTKDGSIRLVWICERMHQLGIPDEDTIAQWLDIDLDAWGTVKIESLRVWAAMHLAGLFRLERVVPKLIDLLAAESGFWDDGIADALSRIGTIGVLDQVVKAYPNVNWLARLYLTGVMEKVRLPGMESALRFLFEGEETDQLRVALAQAISLYATPEAIKIAKGVYEEDPFDKERITLSQDLYAFMTLSGIDDPDLPEWRRNLEERRQRQQDKPSPSVGLTQPAGPRVGRNDPCPCGSGKKFKKCCLGHA